MRIHFPKLMYVMPNDPAEYERRIALGYQYVPQLLFNSAMHQISIVNPKLHGYGIYEGTVTKNDIPLPNVDVSVINKDTFQRIYTVKSKSDGSFYFRNIAKGQPLLFMAYDPDQVYKTVTQDIIL